MAEGYGAWGWNGIETDLRFISSISLPLPICRCSIIFQRQFFDVPAGTEHNFLGPRILLCRLTTGFENDNAATQRNAGMVETTLYGAAIAARMDGRRNPAQ